MELQLRISGFHHEILKKHLLPEDGKEAVAVALCGRYEAERNKILLVHDLILIPHDECSSREDDILIWPTDRVMPYFHRIATHDLAILKIHSHPGGYSRFSQTDDKSDHEFFDSVFGWATNDKPHASAVMLPHGKIFGRFFFSDLTSSPIDKITVAGDQILQFIQKPNFVTSEFAKRTIQAFGEFTYSSLKQMAVGIVGCSGTGSPVIEQLVRLGIGRLVLIDPDVIEAKNLNRIINSTFEDTTEQTPKVTMLSRAIAHIGLGTQVVTHQVNLYNSIAALRDLIKCDIIFGCMDSVDGRFLLNQLATFYLLPYFDLGVKLEADGNGGIKQICSTVHYIQPGYSSLLSRGVYDLEDLKAASQYRKNPEEYAALRKNAYIKNINVNNPAVISVNMQIASHAVNDFLNRIHPYKVESPQNYAASTIDITEGYIVNSDENNFDVDQFLRKRVGQGDVVPFIEITELSNDVA